MSTNVVKLQKTPVAKSVKKPSQKQIKIASQRRAGAYILCACAITATALSLTDLSEGIQLATKAAAWQSWLLAIAIDCSFVSFEIALMVCPGNAKVERIANPAIIGLLVLSAIFNAIAFSAQASGWMVCPAVGLGIVVPAIIFALTKVAGVMLLIDASRK